MRSAAAAAAFGMEDDDGATPSLRYEDASSRERVVRLAEPVARVSIGRGPDNDIALDWDPQVSRLHAEIERISGYWTVADDGLSTNGSFLNGQPVRGRRRLRDGDTLRFGETTVRFRAPGRTDSRSTAIPGSVPTVPRVTEAQQRVLAALCRAFVAGAPDAAPATNRAIAAELFLSEDAVKGHLRTLYAKFGLDSLPQNRKRAALADRALETRIAFEGEPQWRA